MRYAPNFLLKIIPHVDATPRIGELVEYYLEDIILKASTSLDGPHSGDRAKRAVRRPGMTSCCG
jgi:acetoacetate decarboxylase